MITQRQEIQATPPPQPVPKPEVSRSRQRRVPYGLLLASGIQSLLVLAHVGMMAPKAVLIAFPDIIGEESFLLALWYVLELVFIGLTVWAYWHCWPSAIMCLVVCMPGFVLIDLYLAEFYNWSGVVEILAIALIATSLLILTDIVRVLIAVPQGSE
ncbi:MAG: hypothetical protein AB7G88_15555 [Thermomicrobiales bacterium]